MHTKIFDWWRYRQTAM